MPTPANHNFGVQVNVGSNVFSWRPKVSVVIPAYNVAEFISDTLDSALGQKFRDYEIIVVNDGSPDTPALERAIRTRREDIVYIKQPNLGAGAARNTGIQHARGEIIAFLDGDDVWLPEFLASQIAFLGRGYDMVYCDAYRFGMRSVLRKTFMESAPSAGVCDSAALLDFRCNVITSGTVATKDALERSGLFEHERTSSEDFHLWLRMAKNGAKIGYQRKPLLKYRVRLESLSGDAISRVQRVIDLLNRVRKTIPLDEAETRILTSRLAGFETDLQIEYGKSYLLQEDFGKAYQAFAEANRHRRSIKLTAVTFLARVAPRRLLKHYRTRRSDELTFIRSKT